MSASCSMEPLSRRSESIGRLLFSRRFSTSRESCDSAMTGTLNSRAMLLSVREISETSCVRFSMRRAAIMS